MVAAIDISGERYGRLVAVKRLPKRGRRTWWLFRCDCGRETEALLDAVRGGLTRSCGCLRAEATRERSLTHGHRVGRLTTRTLKSYQHAKSRCLNPNDPKYPQYGGRGITMCQEWLTSFEAFLEDMGECPDGRTLDRVDVNGNYEPRNCRWATQKQQSRSRTDNVIVTLGNEKLILKDFAARVGVDYRRLHARMRRLDIPANDAADQILAITRG